ncbi:conserved hypothetical protein, partial [Trichinella spiralis]
RIRQVIRTLTATLQEKNCQKLEKAIYCQQRRRHHDQQRCKGDNFDLSSSVNNGPPPCYKHVRGMMTSALCLELNDNSTRTQTNSNKNFHYDYYYWNGMENGNYRKPKNHNNRQQVDWV